MILVKGHGLGNDYLVLHAWTDGALAPAAGYALDAAGAVGLCDRNRGPGSDGVLEPVPSAVATAGLRIWNPDGSEAEKSGNGLRIFARYLVDHRGAPTDLTIEVPSGVVRCTVDDDAVTVEMGEATLVPHEIPCREPLLDTPIDVLGATLRVTAVGMGNPHCVAFFDGDLDALPWRAWGAALERDGRFPNRTNVQFAAVRSRSLVEARVWERGAGETQASGSSACAVAVAARALGYTEPRIEVRMPGGALHVEVHAERRVTLRGPVEEVGTFRLSEALTKKLMVTR